MYSIFEKLCSERGVTAYRVCKETGITTSTLSNWKAGRYTPKADKLKKIADFFGVSVEYLLTGKEDQSNVSEIKDPDLKEKYLDLEEFLLSGKKKPLCFDGKPVDRESVELLLQQVRISLALLEKSKE